MPQSPLADLTARLARKELSATEAVREHLTRMADSREMNIFITEAEDAALAAAQASDARLADGTARPLEGLPIAVKDNFCTEGVRTTAGSRILDSFVPPYESTVTAKLKAAGAVLIGKTNLDEFAMGSSTETSHYGPTINPAARTAGHDRRVPGGSSGGSAAAMAADLGVGALGTDTGGSIRQPAAFCGVVGFKPSYGVCSRWGIVAYGSSLDQAGVFARSVADAAALMDVIAGEDDKDSTSARGRSYAFARALQDEPKPVKLGLPKEVMALDMPADAALVWDRAQAAAKAMGAELVEVSLPHFKAALPAYYIISLSEASSNLARYDGVRYGHRADNPQNLADMYERTRSEGFGPEVQRRILAGTYSLSAGYYDAYYLKALKVRTLIARDFAQAFEQADALILPTTPTAAFEIGAHTKNPVDMYLEDIFTVPVNLAGLPGLSLPAGTNADGLPLGLQLIGPRLADEALMALGARAEAALEAL